MQTLDHSAYLALRNGAEVLEADSHGDKVLHLPDGNFLKLFRRKRLLSSAALWPYAQRFATNTDALQDRNIPCPRIIAVYRISSIDRDAVYYAPLPGITLRQLIGQPDVSSDLRGRLGQFVARLHASGVYFRSLHLGNIVLTPDNEFGLIDIADMKYQRRPLSRQQRLRNFQHMLRYKADKQWLLQDPAKDFFVKYLSNSNLKMNTPALLQKVEKPGSAQ
jgi:tRNA A-37 threonylcarbamoyl transferase component Bud32